MASSINASTTAGVVTTADTSGVLNIQTAGVTAISIDASQAVSFTNSPTVTGGTANGVAYLNGSKVLTTGSALVFDGANLGVGTTPSAWGAGTSVIDLNTAGNAGAVSASGTLSIAKNGFFNGTNWIYKNTSSAMLYQLISSEHRWSNAASGTAGNAITFTQAMTLDASGNLGVGTTSPASKLNVADTSTNCTVTVTNSASNFQVQSNANDGYFNLNGSGNIIFRSGTPSVTERARIDSSGTLLAYGSSTVRTVASCVAAFGAGAQTNAISINSYDDPGKQFVMSNNNGSTTVFSGNGTAGVNLFLNGSSWSSFSDERIKDIIEPITDAASKVASLRTVIGKYKTDEDGVRRPFLIAQDVQSVLPEAVKVSEDEIGTLNLSYTDMIPLLTAAIKEQQAIIQSLTDRLTVLENK